LGIENEIKQTQWKSEFQKLTLNVMLTNNWLAEKVIEILKLYNITLKQFNVLRILRGQQPEPITIHEIRNRMIDKMSDVSRIVDRLLIKGLVIRELCKENRRAVDVYISENGLKLLEELDSIEDSMEQILGDISEQEAKTVNEILDKMRAPKSA
jgi:MarR family transcriptional regulator, 2-MHQ and catechol-resistance regulon repressor